MQKTWPDYNLHIKTFLDLDVNEKIIPINIFDEKDLEGWLKKQPEEVRCYVSSSRFSAKKGEVLLTHSKTGQIKEVLFGVESVGEDEVFWLCGSLPKLLPENYYYTIENSGCLDIAEIAYVWSLGCYSFMEHKIQSYKADELLPCLVIDTVILDKVRPFLHTTYWVRNMINCSPNKLTPKALSYEANKLRLAYGASLDTIVGEDLVACNYPSVYAVGKASENAPRIIDLNWGDSNNPRITLVGKGVTFDSGGLNIKTPSGMKDMRKDMGGAAHVLGLASIIMEMQLPLQVRVLIGAVENAVSGNSFRPSDSIETRKGISIEIGDTDAEGRVLLCDLLHEASEGKPDLIIDFATLTGSARVALGPDLPAIFSNNDQLARELQDISLECHDPMWHMPLWKPYKKDMESSMADVCTISKSPYGDAINASLFLDMFIPKNIPWLHIDFMGWNVSPRPGRPEGGEVLGLRAIMRLIGEEFNLDTDLL